MQGYIYGTFAYKILNWFDNHSYRVVIGSTWVLRNNKVSP